MSDKVNKAIKISKELKAELESVVDKREGIFKVENLSDFIRKAIKREPILLNIKSQKGNLSSSEKISNLKRSVENIHSSFKTIERKIIDLGAELELEFEEQGFVPCIDDYYIEDVHHDTKENELTVFKMLIRNKLDNHNELKIKSKGLDDFINSDFHYDENKGVCTNEYFFLELREATNRITSYLEYLSKKKNSKVVTLSSLEGYKGVVKAVDKDLKAENKNDLSRVSFKIEEEYIDEIVSFYNVDEEVDEIKKHLLKISEFYIKHASKQTEASKDNISYDIYKELLTRLHYDIQANNYNIKDGVVSKEKSSKTISQKDAILKSLTQIKVVFEKELEEFQDHFSIFENAVNDTKNDNKKALDLLDDMSIKGDYIQEEDKVELFNVLYRTYNRYVKIMIPFSKVKSEALLDHGLYDERLDSDIYNKEYKEK